MNAEFLIGLVLQLAPTLVAATPQDAPFVTLRTVEGQSMKASLVPAADGLIGLQSADFIEPLNIRTDRVASIEFASASRATDRADGLFRWTLTDGSCLHGRLLGVTPTSWHIEAAGMGSLEMPVESLADASQLGGGAAASSGVIYAGPTGLAGWRASKKSEAWAATANSLVTEVPRARLTRDLGLTAGRSAELTVAWANAPRFRVLIGTKESGKGKEVLTVEPWGETLVAWAPGEGGMEVLELGQGLKVDSSLTLRFTLQPGHVAFLDGSGEEIGRFGGSEKAGPCLTMVNDGSRLELSALTVMALGGGGSLRRLGSASITEVTGSGETLSTTGGDVPVGEILGIDFSGKVAGAPPSDAGFQLVYADGRRLSGEFKRITTGGIVIQPAWSESPITCEWAGLSGISVTGAERVSKRQRASRSFLVTSHGEVAGELQSIDPSGNIVWKPTIAEENATLRAEAVERVTINRTTAYYASSRKYPHLMRLRSGDTFRCFVKGVTESTVSYRTSFGGDRIMDVGLVKAIEFDLRSMKRFAEIFADKEEPKLAFFGQQREARRETTTGFDAKSLERALALPRKYKTRRFQHLVLARNGDFLRTNLVSLSAEGAAYPGPSDTNRLIPTQRLAAVVWLDASADDAAGPTVESPIPNARVVLDEQTSLSMELSGADGKTLRGTSAVLGELAIDLTNIISIELDRRVIDAASIYSEWILKPMKEPFPEDAAASASPKVGQAAPAAIGVDLDGKALSLAEFKGQVVLLDFWGHW